MSCTKEVQHGTRDAAAEAVPRDPRLLPPSAGPPAHQGTVLQETPAPIGAIGRTLGLLPCKPLTQVVAAPRRSRRRSAIPMLSRKTKKPRKPIVVRPSI